MYVQTAITVFNKRLSADRREVYFPTCIRSASFLENKSSGHSTDGAHSQSLAYKLRIPANAAVQNGRSYVSEAEYARMDDAAAAGCWTLQTGDYVVPMETALADPIDAGALEELAAHSQLIHVKEYADNTIRGSAAVKHWRIGGE